MGSSSSQLSAAKPNDRNANLATAENSLTIAQREIDREFEKLKDMTSRMLRTVGQQSSPDQRRVRDSAYVAGEAFAAASANPFEITQRAQMRKPDPPQRHKAALNREKLNMLEIDEYDPIKTLDRK